MSTTIARFVTNAARAQTLSDRLAENFAPARAVAAYEIGAHWCVEVHFSDAPNQAVLRDELQRLLDDEAPHDLRFENVPDCDWVAASLARLSPVEAGRFVVHGAHDRGRIAPNRIAIEIEASLAFGTGHHGTTRGCLVAFDLLLKARKRGRAPARAGRSIPCAALDVGTGSGVLAIAAAKSGTRRVLASDIDRAAVEIANENVRRNGAGPSVQAICAAGLAAARFRERGRYALVFANILLEPLKRLAGPMSRLVAPGAYVLLSGLLPAQANAALAMYRFHGMRLSRRVMLDGWATLILQRPAAARKTPRRKRKLSRRW